MHVGMLCIFQNYEGALDDAEHFAAEARLAELAEPLGFESVWAVEHHFTDYAACPDNAQFLSWLAGRTTTIKLATGAFILPWNQPVRVAEKIALLDHLSGGRAILGLGRGLARREYAGMGIEMSESRERFDESAAMVLDALDTGTIRGDGPYYPQAPTEIRPRPLAGFRDRVYAIGMSPDSVEQAARIGARLAVFSSTPWAMWADDALATYRKVWSEHHEEPPPPPLTVDIVYCGADESDAAEIGGRHLPEYYLSVVDHYELLGEHFKELEGYEMYGEAVDLLRAIGKEDQVAGYLDAQAWGTPERILERLASRRDIIGDFELGAIFRFGSMPVDVAAASATRFAEQVLPELASW